MTTHPDTLAADIGRLRGAVSILNATSLAAEREARAFFDAHPGIDVHCYLNEHLEWRVAGIDDEDLYDAVTDLLMHGTDPLDIGPPIKEY